MKIDRFGKLLLLIFCVIGFTSCLNDDEPQDKVETMEAQISPYTQFSGVFMGNEIIEGMSVKFGSNLDFGFMGLSHIEGFTFERGYGYKLRIQRIKLANPPADGDIYTYKLIKVLSKEDHAKSRTETRLYVSSEIGEFKCGDLTQDMPSKGMKIRENEADDWTVGPFNRIEGFEYEKGYNYVLSVEKVVLPKMIYSTVSSLSSYDISPSYIYLQDIQYKLLKVITKEKVAN